MQMGLVLVDGKIHRDPASKVPASCDIRIVEGNMSPPPPSSSSSAAAAFAGAGTKRRRPDESDVVSEKTRAENNRSLVAVVRVAEQNEQQQKEKRLPDELWAKIMEDVDDNSVTAFACASKQLRRVQQASRRRLKTNLGYWKNLWNDNPVLQKGHRLSEKWCLWSLTLTREEKSTRCIMNAAAFGGHLGALKCGKEQGREQESLFREETCAFAALEGHLEVLKYLHEKGCPWDRWTCAKAALGGHLEVLKYAHEKGCPWDRWTCTYAAEYGHLEVLKYAHEHGCPWDEETCKWAARKGHLEVLKYAHANGCPWNEGTCRAAASGGHLEVLKYAHENGCPWDFMTCYWAAEEGHLEVLKYAHENGCPWDFARFRHNSKVKGLRLREEVLAYLETLGDQSSDVESTSHSDSEPF